MTDDEKREKVMWSLECCADNDINRCKECPYCPWKNNLVPNQDNYCFSVMAKDALALLKEQEARVLEYSEIEKHPLVWLEDEDKENVIPALFLQYNGWSAEFSRQAPDEYVDSIVRSAIVIAVEGMYGITWRCWSARPTEEQRKAVKWE